MRARPTRDPDCSRRANSPWRSCATRPMHCLRTRMPDRRCRNDTGQWPCGKVLADSKPRRSCIARGRSIEFVDQLAAMFQPDYSCSGQIRPAQDNRRSTQRNSDKNFRHPNPIICPFSVHNQRIRDLARLFSEENGHPNSELSTASGDSFHTDCMPPTVLVCPQLSGFIRGHQTLSV